MLLALAFSSLAATLVASPPIVIDGRFDDWAEIVPAMIDPADAEKEFIDFGEIKIASDERFVHFMIDLRRTVNLQGLDGTAMLLLDVDGDPNTGRAESGLEGVDIIIDLTPPNIRTPGAPGMGIGLRSPTHQPPVDPVTGQPARLNPYDIGFSFAPTHASRRTEIRIERGRTLPDTAPLFTTQSMSVKLAYINLAGELRDETDAIRAELPSFNAAPTVHDHKADPLARHPQSDLRVLSWNAFHGGIFTRSDPFHRVLAALKPDIILWQELPDTEPASRLEQLLTDSIPPGDNRRWTVHLGEGGGDLRCAVATIFPSSVPHELKNISFPAQPDRTLRIAAASIEVNSRALLAISAHLKCCGRAGGAEDEGRMLEVALIQDNVQKLFGSSAIQALLIGGDLNLVGSRHPLENLITGLDLDHSALSVADPHQLDGRTNATWGDPRQPFSPGRLDYAVYSDSTIQLRQSFVLDTSDLSPNWLRHHGLHSDDTAMASDHFPIVLDFDLPDAP